VGRRQLLELTAESIPPPSTAEATIIASRVLGERIESTTRFTTGLANYVFAVKSESSEEAVVRIAPVNSPNGMAPAIYWNRRHRPLASRFRD
jgi:hypothetical protein